MSTKRSQYQQGSIRKVRKAKGYAWEVRFSERLNGKRFQRTMTFQGSRIRTRPNFTSLPISVHASGDETSSTRSPLAFVQTFAPNEPFPIGIESFSLTPSEC